jgi:protein TonB
MSERSYYEQKGLSPTSLLVVVAAHAAAITALALSKMDMPIFERPRPITVEHIPLPPEPPEIPPEPVQRQPDPPVSVITRPTPIIPPPPSNRDPVAPSQPVEPSFGYTAGSAEGNTVQPLPLPPPPPPPAADPVRVQARLKSGIELLPPYPPAEERAEREGKVVVRLVIGVDGRVKSVEKVSAASEAFWRATERHALRAWRFSPATVDGKPVESTHMMTVNFQLRG